MAIKPNLNKAIYGSAMLGDGYSSITKTKKTTGGIYADGIGALTPINGNSIGGIKTPSLSMPDVSKQLNGAVVRNGAIGRGGSTGGVTKEGAIIGGGANNTTFNNITSGSKKIVDNKPVTGSLGVTKLPTAAQFTQTGDTQTKYADFLTKAQALKNAADSVATKSNESTTEKTDTATEKPATYEEYLQQQRELLDKRKTEADKQAEAAKERAAVDAQASYAQNMATYGANAESMAQMGLTGGGYGDYINAQAYAQKRADMQQASVTERAEKAQNTATYEDAISALNKTELEYKEKQEQEQKNQDAVYASLWEKAINPDSNYTEENIAALGREYGLSDSKIEELKNVIKASRAEKNSNLYASLLGYANDGTYSAEQIAAIAREKGLNDEQIKGLTDAATKYKDNIYKTNYSSFMGSIEQGNMTKNILDTALKNDTITQEQYNDLLNKYQTSYYDEYNNEITSNFGAVSTDSIDKSLQRGEITQEQYNELKSKYNASVESAIISATLFYENGVKIDEKNAKALAEKLKNSGWLSDENKSKVDTFLADDYKPEDSGGCFAKGTMITVADGSQIAVENLKEGDNILVFNHTTGGMDVAPVSYIFRDGQKDYEVLTLHFGDATNIDVLFEHGFFDIDSKKYVLINAENAKEFIGHRFYHVAYVDGAYENKPVTLSDFNVHTEQTECYSVLTAAHINHIANGMLAVTDDIKGIYNIFELDDAYKYDTEKMAADIEHYGLFTYDDWREYATPEQFEAFNGAYMKVAVGKGLVTIDEIVGYIKRFLQA